MRKKSPIASRSRQLRICGLQFTGFDDWIIDYTSLPDTMASRNKTVCSEGQEAGDVEAMQLLGYEPPEALAHVPNITSEVIMAVVQSSLENIKNQLSAEKERFDMSKSDNEAATEARVQVPGSQVGEDRGKGKAKDLDPEQESSFSASSIPPAGAGSSKAPKRSRFGFRRKLHQFKETIGETSQAGSQSSARSPASPSENLRTGEGSSFAHFIHRHTRKSHSSDVTGDNM
jgi:hypothetical protein